MQFPQMRGAADPRLRSWNDTATGYPRDHCLHELFESRAIATPHAPAVRHNGRELTYRELSQQSDDLTRRLLAAGVQPGDTVGVIGGRCPEALVAFLAIVKCGAAYTPLDDEYPPARLRAMAEDADVRTAVALPGNTSRIRRLRACLDVLSEQRDTASEPIPRAHVTAGDCAYVMFTSGSTGRPKPVAIPHRGVVRLAVSHPDLAPPTARDRVLHAYSLSSDASTIEIWSALLAGACLVIIDRETLLSPSALHRVVSQEKVSVAFLTTSVLHHVARNQPDALRPLRFVSAGGEALDPALCHRFLAACPDTTLVNFYGPTENSVVSTAHVVRDLPADATSVPIGRPFANSTCYVTREDGSLADIGEEGELLVGGDGLAIGYLGDAALTDQRFFASPFPGRPGERLYRTGDHACWRTDGLLEYRGRRDRQLKLRGHRIELDEIEARLRAHPTVGEAVVEAVGEPTDTQLVAFVTAAQADTPVIPGDLRQELASWLPPPAVPGRIHHLARFPVTDNGKVDRRALMAQAVRGTRTSAPPPPRSTERAARSELSPLTRTLAEIWHRTLRAHPSPSDGFFDLGGDSLLAAEVVTRTLSVLDLDSTHGTFLIRSLLRTPTLEDYSTAVRRAQRATSVGPGETSGGPDFEQDARLGLRLPTTIGPAPHWRQPRRVLLTGASGFVGAFLLDRLARQTRADLYCPVRARSEEHARRRVLANLSRYGLSAQSYAERLRCFPADLAAPRLGLPEARYVELASTLDLIVHSGAHVNFLYPYTALRPANVEGTRELVRLAASRRVPLHFLSTIAVLAGFGTAGIRYVDEDTPLDHADRLTMGYAESKWVAERMLREAAQLGLPVTVYRPYEVTGEQRTGICNTETAISSLFRMISDTGVAPDIPLPLDFVPVDHLADAVVHIATHETADGRTYHLTNPRPARLADMLDRMRAAGYDIRELPYAQWVGELVRHAADNPTSPTVPFVSLCVDRGHKSDISVKEMYLHGVFPILGRRNITQALRGSQLVCPPTDAALLDRYLEFFFSSGYLLRPATTPA